MSTRRAFLKAAGVVSGGVVMGAGERVASGAGPATAPASPLLVPHWDGVRSAGEWWGGKREGLKKTILEHLGRPSNEEKVELSVKVLEEHEEGEYRRLKVGYMVEAGEEVRAWVLVPPKEKRRKGAGVVCLHGTTPVAKDSLIFPGEKPGRDLARMLSVAGFVTISPDHCCSGERFVGGGRPYDSSSFYKRHPGWSMVGKAAYDGSKAIDVLLTFEEVDKERVGVMGHSLGGQGAAFVGAFDERVKCGVNSCGLTTWSGNPKLSHWAREEWYVYFPHLRPYIKEGRKLPFDLYEFVGLVAPRAFLNVFGMTDMTYGGDNSRIAGVAGRLQELYTMLGRPERLGNFLAGMPHDVPAYSRALMLSWMETHLVG